jgi:hypothetical protein
MWTVVYLAHNKIKAEKIKDYLLREGLLVKTQPVGNGSVQEGYYEVMVPEFEAEEAQGILFELGV